MLASGSSPPAPSPTHMPADTVKAVDGGGAVKGPATTPTSHAAAAGATIFRPFTWCSAGCSAGCSRPRQPS